MNKPQADAGEICPLWHKDVSKVCHKCPWWVQIRGTNPQTGKEIDQWGCAIALQPILTIEGAQMSRQTGAAVESFRNEMVKTGDMIIKLAYEKSVQNLLTGESKDK